jgi:hypothetical protein
MCFASFLDWLVRRFSLLFRHDAEIDAEPVWQQVVNARPFPAGVTPANHDVPWRRRGLLAKRTAAVVQMHSHAKGTSLPEKIHPIADTAMYGKGNRCLITLTDACVQAGRCIDTDPRGPEPCLIVRIRDSVERQTTWRRDLLSSREPFSQQQRYLFSWWGRGSHADRHWSVRQPLS